MIESLSLFLKLHYTDCDKAYRCMQSGTDFPIFLITTCLRRLPKLTQLFNQKIKTELLYRAVCWSSSDLICVSLFLKLHCFSLYLLLKNKVNPGPPVGKRYPYLHFWTLESVPNRHYGFSSCSCSCYYPYSKNA